MRSSSSPPGPSTASSSSTASCVYAGDAVGTVAAGHGLVVVAYEVAGDKPFRLRIAEDGKLRDPIAFARPGKADNSPFAIAATATPDGFTIFYQEVQNNDPTAAHTYMLELDGEGKARRRRRRSRCRGRSPTSCGTAAAITSR